MKFYKVLAVSAISVFLFASSALAALPAEVKIEDGGVRAVLTGSVDMHDYGFADGQIKNRKPYYPLQLSVVITEPSTGKRLYVNQIEANDSGEYETGFILDCEYGSCDIKIYTPYGLIYDGTVDYKDGTVDKFNEISKSGDVSELKNFLNSYNKYMGLDLSLFAKFNDEEQSNVLGFVMKNVPYATKNEVKLSFSDAVFNIGLTSDALTDDDKSAMFDEYMQLLGEDYAGIAAFINENGLGAKIISLYNSGEYSSVKDDIYKMSLRAFLTDSVENIYDLEVLFGEENLFSVPESIMKKYMAVTERTTFYSSLYKKKDDIKTLEDFYLQIEKCIPEESKSTDSKRGSGGSSKVSGPSASIPAAPVNPSPSVPDNGALQEFSDLESHSWAKTAIYALVKLGAVNGADENRFLPAESITREEFAKITAFAFDITSDGKGKTDFADIKDGDWFKAPIESLVSNGVINGISEKEFGVGRQITRQDAAVILSRVLKSSQPGAEYEKYADDGSIAEYARDGIYALKSGGMLSGYEDNTFRPEANLSRAEAAQMIYNVLKLGKGGTYIE